MDLALVAVMTILNLRGLRESGSIFALPTYFFVVSASLLIVVGLVKAYIFLHQPLIGQFTPTVQAIEPLSLLIILRSFATGCTAMTGIEAAEKKVPKTWFTSPIAVCYTIAVLAGALPAFDRRI